MFSGCLKITSSIGAISVKQLLNIYSEILSGIYVFSMLSLGHILLSDLFITDLFMYSLSGVILLYLPVSLTLYYAEGVFAWDMYIHVYTYIYTHVCVYKKLCMYALYIAIYCMYRHTYVHCDHSTS